MEPKSDVLTMTNSHTSRQICQVLLCSDDLSAKAVSFPSIDFASMSTCGNSASILTSVLKDWEPVIDNLNSRFIRIREDGSDNPAHSVSISKTLKGISREGLGFLRCK
jgi:hypothetical protein